MLVSLAQCEHEQLHLSGAIQPHGVLLVINNLGTVTHCSANSEPVLGWAVPTVLGAPLTEALREVVMARLHAGERRFLLDRALNCNGERDVLVSAGSDQTCTLEIYPHQSRSTVLPHQPDLLTPQQHAHEVQRIQQQMLEDVAALTGFERVMMYQFRDDGDGEVVAEVRQPDVYGRYWGLRFPASDVPQIARALYLKNPWRLIPDAQAQAVPVMGIHTDAPDLSYCDLRSVSPMHQIYLGNMGVRASLSFPVVVNASLVALVACHHSAPKTLTTQVLQACRVRVSNFTFAYASYSAHQRMRLVDGLHSRFNGIRLALQRDGDVASAWETIAPWVVREFDLHGVTLCRGDTVLHHGVALQGPALETVESWFEVRGEIMVSEESLSRHVLDFPLTEVAGVTALRIGTGAVHATRLYLCRCELVQEIAWGGNPEKPVEFNDGKLGIAPRRSFEKWVEKRHGYCRPWDNTTRLLALKLRELLTNVHG